MAILKSSKSKTSFNTSTGVRTNADRTTTQVRPSGGSSSSSFANNQSEALARTNAYERSVGSRITTSAEAATQQQQALRNEQQQASRNTSVNSTNMSDATASLPPPPPPIKTSDVGANNAGLVEGLPGYTYQDGAFTQTPTDTTGATTPLADQVSSYLKSQKDFVGTPPSAKKIYQESGAAERDTAKQLVNTYTGQLNTIVANRDASNLALTGQGRGIPEAIIGGQQAQISKEAAITALPIQALLANAQGNYELAQTHLDETFKIRMADATSQYQYRSDLYKSVYDIADKAQQRQLDAKQKTADQNFTLYKDFINFNRDAYKDFGITAGSALAKLPTLDTSDPNFMQNFSDQQSEASKIYSKFAVSKSEATELSSTQQTKVDAINIVNSQLNNYRNLYDASVGFAGNLITGEKAAELRTARAALEFAVASAVGTGALQAADRDVVRDVIPDPTSVTGSFGSLIRGGKSGGLKSIDQARNIFNASSNTIISGSASTINSSTPTPFVINIPSGSLDLSKFEL